MILHGLIVNVYIVYEICINIRISDYPTLKSCLFGADKLTKNADINKYGYSGYGIEIDRHGSVLVHPLCLGNISKDWSVDNMKKWD